MDTCNVCYENYNSKNRAVTICPQVKCNFTCCKKCMKTYILEDLSEAHCMNCKFVFDDEYILTNINITFLKKEYTKKKMDMFYELEKSLIPSTQEEAKKRLLCNEEDRKISICKEYIKEQTKLIKMKKEEIKIFISNKQKIMDTITIVKGQTFKCPLEHCNGYICDYKCGICDTLLCETCLGIKKDDIHECNEDDIKTSNLIKNDTKPCPKCKTRIYKIDGCDQMWCTECKTAFSWKTSKIHVKNIHNPHYLNYIRNNGIENRTYGDVRCGGIPNTRINWHTYQLKMKEYLNSGTQSHEELLSIYKLSKKISSIIIKYDSFTSLLYRSEINRGVENNKLNELRISYIIGKIDVNKWKKMIYKTNQDMERDAEHRQLMDLVFNVGLEILIDFNNKLETKDEFDFKDIKKIFIDAIKLKAQYDTIINYTNTISIRKINVLKKSAYLIKDDEISLNIHLYNKDSLHKF